MSSKLAVVVLLLASRALAVPYTAPNVTGRAEAACLGAGNPYPCCTGPGVGNCIKDTDFTAHTEALEAVDAILRSDTTQPANYVLAGPTTGANATPGWRALVLKDLPDDGTADKCLRSGGSGGDPAYEACGPEVNPVDYGASSSASATDNCTAFTAAANALPAAGGRWYLPAGTYTTDCSIPVYDQSIYEGDGAGATTIQTPTTGTGFPIFRVATPRTCTGGTGDATTCDDTIDGGTRGPSCVCYTNADCQSGTCAGGTVQRATVLRNLKVVPRVAGAIGIDFSLVGEGVIEQVDATCSSALTNSIGIAFSDGGGTVSGYSNTVTESKIRLCGTGIRIMDRANDTRIERNVISSGNTTGLQIDSLTSDVRVRDNLFQSNGTQSVLDNGRSTVYSANRWEDDTSHLVIGAAAYDVRIEDSQRFSGAGTPITNSGTRTTLGGAVLTDSPATCAADTNGQDYYDLSIYNTDAPKPPTGGGSFTGNSRSARCVCNSSHSSGARWCQADGDGCTSNTSCG